MRAERKALDIPIPRVAVEEHFGVADHPSRAGERSARPASRCGDCISTESGAISDGNQIIAVGDENRIEAAEIGGDTSRAIAREGDDGELAVECFSGRGERITFQPALQLAPPAHARSMVPPGVARPAHPGEEREAAVVNRPMRADPARSVKACQARTTTVPGRIRPDEVIFGVEGQRRWFAGEARDHGRIDRSRVGSGEDQIGKHD